MTGINHNIDELLVGVIKQIRLREEKQERKKDTKVTWDSILSFRFSMTMRIRAMITTIMVMI